MQYGVEISPYKRIVKKNKKKSKASELDLSLIKRMIFYGLSGVLISRVILINFIAPFGIAFLVVTIIEDKDVRIKIAAGIGTLIGYATLFESVKNIGMYFIVIGSVIGLSYIKNNLSHNNKLTILFSFISIEFLMWRIFLEKEILTIALLNTFTEIICILPVYYIMRNSIVCVKKINSRHLFTNEQIISMSITLAFIVAGTWGISIFGISLRNIIAIYLVATIGYIKGAASGSACGITMGIIIGLISQNMIIYVGVFGVCGLIIGTFKDTSKWFSGITCLICLIMVKLYSDIGIDLKIIEVLISFSVFLAVPNKFYKKLEVELDYNKKEEEQKDDYIHKVKGILIQKLNDFSDVLFNMSETLEKLVDNDKLAMKNKSVALIENLGDRVCSNCSMNSICWRRETYFTYNAFGELIQNYQERKQVMPKELQNKCIQSDLLKKNAEEITNKYIINEMWRKRLNEGRGVLAAQISNMAGSVGEIIEEFNTSIKFNTDMECTLKKVFNKYGIEYKELMCFNDKQDRLVIKLNIEACGGKHQCVKKILPIINQAVTRIMCISGDGCNIDYNTKNCEVTFEETPKYHIKSYIGKECKEGESINGDSSCCDKLNDGTYMAIISDGMGSGAQAGRESKAAVELIERFAKAGFSKLSAINTVNSIMSIKFTEDEKFSTVDMSSLDLYLGEVDFIKVGAVPSFIKRGNEVDVIKSKTLPIGVLDKVDVDIINKRVKNGDLIVMVSDGILDYSAIVAGKFDWMVKFLKETTTTNPESLSREIIEKAKALSGGKVKDDMTVIVQEFIVYKVI